MNSNLNIWGKKFYVEELMCKSLEFGKHHWNQESMRERGGKQDQKGK